MAEMFIRFGAIVTLMIAFVASAWAWRTPAPSEPISVRLIGALLFFVLGGFYGGLIVLFAAIGLYSLLSLIIFGGAS